MSRPPSGSRIVVAGATVFALSASSSVSASCGPKGATSEPQDGSWRVTAIAIPGQGSIGSTGASVPNGTTAPASRNVRNV